jgi:hypothetical protein
MRGRKIMNVNWANHTEAASKIEPQLAYKIAIRFIEGKKAFIETLPTNFNL